MIQILKQGFFLALIVCLVTGVSNFEFEYRCDGSGIHDRPIVENEKTIQSQVGQVLLEVVGCSWRDAV